MGPPASTTAHKVVRLSASALLNCWVYTLGCRFFVESTRLGRASTTTSLNLFV